MTADQMVDDLVAKTESQTAVHSVATRVSNKVGPMVAKKVAKSAATKVEPWVVHLADPSVVATVAQKAAH